MDQQPKIPTLKDSQKPQVKVRGIGMGLTLAERLKQFKKKDLAFILAGLGVLFMAPLAEHFMMAPESSDGTLQAGWGKGGSGSGSNIFGSGGSPYDRTDGLAPGSPMGGGSDLITPLNVRDPSSLIVGAGAAQQPPTNSAVSPTPPAGTHTDSDMKDALAAASARGIGAAAKKAALPVPKVALGGSGLRGLGVTGGGTSASASLGPISAGNVPNRAAGGDSTGNARSMKGYNGVARGQTAGGGGLDALKAAAGKAAENMNRGGGALSDLNAAANTAIPNSGSSSSGSGGPGGGREDKGFGGNQDKNSKNIGESLAFLDMKARMEKDRELEYKKKELNDMGLLWSQMRNEGMKTIFGAAAKGIGDGIGSCVGNFMKGKACIEADSGTTALACTPSAGGAPVVLPVGKKVDACTGKEGGVSGWTKSLDGVITVCGSGQTFKPGTCSAVGGDGSDVKGGGAASKDAVTGVGGVSLEDIMSLNDLGGLCARIADEEKRGPDSSPGISGFVADMKAQVNQIAGVQVALLGGNAPSPCTATPVPGESHPSVKDLLKDSIEQLGGIGEADGGVIKAVKESVGNDGGDVLDIKAAEQKLADAKNAIKAVSDRIGATKMPELPSEVKNSPIVADKFNQYIAMGNKANQAVLGIGQGMNNALTAISKQKDEVAKMVGSEGTVGKVMAQNKSFTEKVKTPATEAVPPLKVNEPVAPKSSGAGSSTEADSKLGAVANPIALANDAIKNYAAEKDPKKQKSLKEPAETAINTASKAVGDMRGAQLDWATAVKKDLRAQEVYVVSPAPAGAPATP